jgi:hypothetical protein
MRPDELKDERVDAALRRQPRWEPPPDFASMVVIQVCPANYRRPNTASPMAATLRVAVVTTSAAIVTLAAAALLHQTTVALSSSAMVAAARYEMLIEFSAAAAREHAVALAWVSASLMLAIAGSLSARFREWL